MDRHAKTKLIFKITGGVLLAAGIVFAVIGFVDFFSSIGEDVPHAFWCFFLGFPLIAAGGVLLAMGFRREMMRYMQREGVPVVNETAREIKPAVAAVASAVKEGLSEPKNICACGAENGAESKFCKKCGKPLIKTCPHCAAAQPSDGVFCDNCGKKL